MKPSLFAALGLASLAASSLALAATSLPPAPNFAAPFATTAQSPKAAGATSTPGTPMANAYRAYPPSCASYPLPDKPSGPTYTGSAAAFANPMGYYNGWYFGATETLTVTVWRLPCSSSGAAVPYNTTGAKNAMTLVRIDRANDSATATVPIMPQIVVFQGDIDASNVASKKNVRLATEPNTVLSDRKFGSPYDLFTTSTTFVLENYPSSDAPHFNFNDAFTLQVNAGAGSANISVPVYSPTADTYPDATEPLPLDGYAAAQYYNPGRSEGLIVQVAEGYDSANPTHRQVAFDLMTKDADNHPFWIVGNAAFNPVPGGVRSLDIPVSFLVENNATQDWGTAHLVMTNCNELTVTFTPKADLPEGVPSISGPISYTRLLSANGMTCE